jgi:hypothetical protein
VTPPAPPTPPATPEVKPPPPKADSRPATLDEQLLKQAPLVLGYLREKGYKNVGVLKFRIRLEGEEEPSDNVGPLNQALATRLEMALVLADDDKEPVGIIQDANTVAAFTKANHLAEAGRPPLFAPKYPLAWGQGTMVKPDAFLTGGVLLSQDLRRMKVWLFAFGKEADSTVRLGEPFIASCDPGLLVEAGESFLVRGALGKEPDTLTPAKAIQAAVAVRNELVPSPLIDQAAPVKLEVHYDDKVVPVEFKDGKFRIPEPKEGQKVSVVVRRQAATNERLGLVLKVNGASTLFRERAPDAQCRKWVLEPGTDALTIDRFQTEDKEDAGDIQVQAVSPSKSGEIRYSPDVGTVSLVVFRERAKGEAPRGEGAEDQAALAHETYPRDKPGDLAGLKERLHKDAAPENAGKSLAAPAKAGDAPQETDFRADPTPVMAITAACYRP